VEGCCKCGVSYKARDFLSSLETVSFSGKKLSFRESDVQYILLYALLVEIIQLEKDIMLCFLAVGLRNLLVQKKD
jgi:hypothetical protein